MKNPSEKLLAPCSYLDIEKFQSWLEDLSQQGYLLHKPGLVRNTYLFHRISPLKARYRLTPVSDRLEDWNQRPDSERQSLTEAFGWEYVCSVDGFHIYRSYSDDDRELHSDPRVLAESLRLVRGKALRSAFAVFLSPVLYWLILTVLVGPNHIWRYLIHSGWILYVSFTLLFLFTTIKGIYRTIKLLKLHRLLRAGKLPIRHQDWKTGETRFHLSSGATFLIGILLIASIALFRTSAQTGLRYQDHPSDSSALPFATILDLAQSGNAQSARRLEAGGMVHWTQPFSQENYTWTEIVDVVSADGTEGRFSMELSWYELDSIWLADRLTEEYLKEAKSTGTPQEKAPALDADLAYFYTDHRGCPAALFRCGGTVVRVCFVRADFWDADLNLDAWLSHTLSRKNN